MTSPQHVGLEQLTDRYRTLLADVRAGRRHADEARALLQRTGIVDASGVLWVVDDSSDPDAPRFLAGVGSSRGVAPARPDTFAGPGTPVSLEAPPPREADDLPGPELMSGSSSPYPSPPSEARGPHNEPSPEPHGAAAPPGQATPGTESPHGAPGALNRVLRERWKAVLLLVVAAAVVWSALPLLTRSSPKQSESIPSASEMSAALETLGSGTAHVDGEPSPELTAAAGNLRAQGWVWRPAGAATIADGQALATVEAIDHSAQVAATALVSWKYADGTWRVASWGDLAPVLPAGPPR